jgi:hypothetical protein
MNNMGSRTQFAKYRVEPHNVSSLGDPTANSESHFVGGSKALMGSQGGIQFKSRDVAGQKLLGIGKWNRGSAVDWSGTETATPGFIK